MAQSEQFQAITRDNRESSGVAAHLDGFRDGLLVADGRGNILYVNRAYSLISGLEAEALMGENVLALVESGVFSASAELLALQTQKPVSQELTFNTGRQAITTSTPIYDVQSGIILVVTDIRDITESAGAKDFSRRQQEDLQKLRQFLREAGELVAEDMRLLETLRVVGRAARLDSTILIQGETGVGKERVAEYIHKSSGRQGLFVRVNCGAIPEQLIESELFGYVPGAFTGASKTGKDGLFKLADGGTIFLDEIGELHMSMQVRLLRVLQEQEITPVGGTHPIKINVRVLAATNRDLEQMAQQGDFRSDLFYRLNVFPVTVPPLRERPDDIIPLAEHLLAELNRKYGQEKTFTPSARFMLKEYRWPGNVRELKNIVERAFIVSGETIESCNLALQVPRDAFNLTEPDQPLNLKESLERLEYHYITNALKNHPSVREAARSLSMDSSTFFRKQKNYEKKFGEVE